MSRTHNQTPTVTRGGVPIAGRTITATSLAPSIVTVSPASQVTGTNGQPPTPFVETGVAAGTGVVHYAADAASADCTVTVTASLGGGDISAWAPAFEWRVARDGLTPARLVSGAGLTIEHANASVQPLDGATDVFVAGGATPPTVLTPSGAAVLVKPFTKNGAGAVPIPLVRRVAGGDTTSAITASTVPSPQAGMYTGAPAVWRDVLLAPGAELHTDGVVNLGLSFPSAGAPPVAANVKMEVWPAYTGGGASTLDAVRAGLAGYVRTAGGRTVTARDDADLYVAARRSGTWAGARSLKSLVKRINVSSADVSFEAGFRNVGATTLKFRVYLLAALPTRWNDDRMGTLDFDLRPRALVSGEDEAINSMTYLLLASHRAYADRFQGVIGYHSDELYAPFELYGTDIPQLVFMQGGPDGSGSLGIDVRVAPEPGQNRVNLVYQWTTEGARTDLTYIDAGGVSRPNPTNGDRASVTLPITSVAQWPAACPVRHCALWLGRKFIALGIQFPGAAWQVVSASGADAARTVAMADGSPSVATFADTVDDPTKDHAWNAAEGLAFSDRDRTAGWRLFRGAFLAPVAPSLADLTAYLTAWAASEVLSAPLVDPLAPLGPEPVASVVFATPGPITTAMSDTTPLTFPALALNTYGGVIDGVPFTYSSSNTAAVTVNASTGAGLRVGPGAATITASDGAGHTATVSVTVSAATLGANDFDDTFASTLGAYGAGDGNWYRDNDGRPYVTHAAGGANFLTLPRTAPSITNGQLVLRADVLPNAGFVFRRVDADNYCVLTTQGDAVRIAKVVAGVETQLAYWGGSVLPYEINGTHGDVTITLTVDGANGTCHVNGNAAPYVCEGLPVQAGTVGLYRYTPDGAQIKVREFTCYETATEGGGGGGGGGGTVFDTITVTWTGSPTLDGASGFPLVHVGGTQQYAAVAKAGSVPVSPQPTFTWFTNYTAGVSVDSSGLATVHEGFGTGDISAQATNADAGATITGTSHLKAVT